jgi:hypothetical protein
MIVNDQAALTAALKAAKGGETFELAPGTYPQVSISARTFATPITITSVDPANPAIVQDIDVSKSSGVAFEFLVIGSPIKPGEAIGVNSAAVTVGSSKYVSFYRCHVHGSLDDDATNDRYGISCRNSSFLTIDSCTFEQLTRAALFGSCTDVVVSGSSFMHLRSDGCDFAACQRVTIDNNLFADYSPIAGDHPDAIQFWTTGTVTPNTDIVIKNNMILFGGGVGAQGIFMRDEVGTLPYARVTIDNNLIYVVNGYNGMAVGNGTDITVTNNTVLSRSRDQYKIRISLGTIKGGVVSKNVADYLLTGTLTGVVQEGNLWLEDKLDQIALIPTTMNGPATTYADLVIKDRGYQPVPGPGASYQPSAENMEAGAAGNVPLVIPAGTVLAAVSLASGVPADTSGYKSPVGVFKSSDVVGTGDTATYRLSGRNYFEVAKSSQLFDLSAFTLSFSLQRDGVDGHIMRIHNSWYVSLGKGELTFKYTSANDKTYTVTSKGAKLTDTAPHTITILFDANAGTLAIVVDGNVVGSGTIAGATKGPASWGLAVGNPFGESLHGQIGAVKLTAGAAPASTKGMANG